MHTFFKDGDNGKKPTQDAPTEPGNYHTDSDVLPIPGESDALPNAQQ